MVLLCGTFHAWVTIEGKEVAEWKWEYPASSDANDISKCWIASEEGRSFKVHWKDTKYCYPTRGRVYIDGIPCGGKILSQDKHEQVKEGYRIGPTEKRQFVFRKIHTDVVSQSSGLSLSSVPRTDPNRIGEIYLEIQRVNMLGKKTYDQTHTLPEGQLRTEEETKGKVHELGFGKPVKSQLPPYVHKTELIGPPVAKFRFLYAPLGLLRAKNIAPLGKHVQSEFASGSSRNTEVGVKSEAAEQIIPRLDTDAVDVLSTGITKRKKRNSVNGQEGGSRAGSASATRKRRRTTNEENNEEGTWAGRGIIMHDVIDLTSD